MATPVILLQRALVALIVAGAFIHLALRWPLLTDPRIDLGGGEMNVVYGAQKLLLGEPLYSDPEEAPFEVVQYTPLYHAVFAIIAKSLGVDGRDTAGLFLVGRSIGLLLNLITAWLVLAICRKLGMEGWTALAAAALTLAFITEHCFDRPDALASALLLGMVLVLTHDEGVALSPSRAAWAAALAIGAVFTKQNMILAPLIAIVHLAASRDRISLQRILAFVGLFGAVAACVLLLMATPDVLWKNLVVSLRNGLGFTLYSDLADLGVYKYYGGWHVLTVIAAIALLRRGSTSKRLLAISALGASAAGLLGGMKLGSSMNYLVDAHILGLIAGLAWLHSLRPASHRWAMVGVLLYGALFTQHRLRLLAKRMGTEQDRVHHAKERAADLAVQAWLLEQGGQQSVPPVFLTYRGHLELLLNGIALLPQKDILEWSRVPPFDLNRFDVMMRAGDVRYVISDRPIESLHLLRWSYPLNAPIATMEGRWIYRPAR